MIVYANLTELFYVNKIKFALGSRILFPGKYKKLFFCLCLYLKSSLSINNKYEKIYKIFHFQTLQVPSWIKRKAFLILGPHSSIFWNVRNFFKVRFYIFWTWKEVLLKISFLEYEKSFFWQNIRKFHFPKYKTILKLEAEKFYFPKYKKFFQSGFFIKK